MIKKINIFISIIIVLFISMILYRLLNDDKKISSNFDWVGSTGDVNSRESIPSELKWHNPFAKED